MPGGAHDPPEVGFAAVGCAALDEQERGAAGRDESQDVHEVER